MVVTGAGLLHGPRGRAPQEAGPARRGAAGSWPKNLLLMCGACAARKARSLPCWKQELLSGGCLAAKAVSPVVILGRRVAEPAYLPKWKEVRRWTGPPQQQGASRAGRILPRGYDRRTALPADTAHDPGRTRPGVTENNDGQDDGPAPRAGLGTRIGAIGRVPE